MLLVLDILRHGEAMPTGPGGDAGRTLSPYGVMEIRALGARLAASGWRPDRVFASPLARARETAGHIVSGLDPEPAVELMEALQPEADPDEVLEALDAAGATSGRVLLVSHMPLVSRLCGYLSGAPHGFQTGELARLECVSLARGGSGTVIFPGRPDSD
jgi:phosphohistidine phosphatase